MTGEDTAVLLGFFCRNNGKGGGSSSLSAMALPTAFLHHSIESIFWYSRITTIYYFSGTGNSFSAACRICDVLDDCTTLDPFVSLAPQPQDIVPAADCVGIVCPAYDAGLSAIVAEAVHRLVLSVADRCEFSLKKSNGQNLITSESDYHTPFGGMMHSGWRWGKNDEEKIQDIPVIDNGSSGAFRGCRCGAAC